MDENKIKYQNLFILEIKTLFKIIKNWVISNRDHFTHYSLFFKIKFYFLFKKSYKNIFVSHRLVIAFFCFGVGLEELWLWDIWIGCIAGWTMKGSTFMLSQLGLCCCLIHKNKITTVLSSSRSTKWKCMDETNIGKGWVWLICTRFFGICFVLCYLLNLIHYHSVSWLVKFSTIS